MSSKFQITITRTDHKPVTFRPGGGHERDLVNAIVTKVISKGVGFFKTEAKVKEAIQQSLEEILYELKSEVKPI